MEKKEILSTKEAQELLQRLEQFYKEPVLPFHNFCHAITLWMECVAKNNTDPALVQGGWAYGDSYFKSLNQMRIDIRKSNLLGRLLHAKEPLRTRMCPLHKGHYSGEAMFFQKCLHLCDGTGWLREREKDGGYTGGLSIREGKIEGGEFKIRDPETGEWKKLE